jgi:hypothetical protein
VNGAAILCCTLLVACAAGGSERRHVEVGQDYSVDQPDGWEATSVRGATRIAPGPSAKEAKHTITIRAADRPHEIVEGKRARREDIVAATERVLRAMPQAKLEHHRELEGDALSGVRFSVTFVPRGLATKYRRQHVLLFGSSSRIFHVFYTAPAHEPVNEDAFETVVTTLRVGV